MKMKKVLLGAFLFAAVSLSSWAQNPGADYLSLGETKLAKDYFMKAMRQSPAEAHFYLGEIAYNEGNLTEAKANYEKGLAASPESALSAVGLAKLQLKSDAKAGTKALEEIQKKNKKDVIVLLAIAKAFSDNGLTEKADKAFETARKADKKSPWIYIYEGDKLAAKQDPGQAAAQYDQAINFDPNCIVAYLKGAQVYEYINYETAMSLLKKATEINPSYRLTYKYIGKIANQKGVYPASIEAYDKYFEMGDDYTMDDLTRYASSNFFTNNYDKAITLIDKGLAVEPNNFVLNRLQMYSNNAIEDFGSGLTSAERFFSIQRDTIKYITQDYTTYANILMKTNQPEKAIEAYKQAIALDDKNIELPKEVASMAAEVGLTAAAGDFFQQYIDRTLASDEEAVIQPTDYYQLGFYYYQGGSKAMRADTTTYTVEEVAKLQEEGKATLKKADAAFAKLEEVAPESYLGSFWRARTNATLDPETTEGLARPFYEETIARVLKSEDQDNTKTLSEAYRYLGYYYFLQFDANKKPEAKAKAIESCQKLLEIDPTNQMATQLLEFLQ